MMQNLKSDLLEIRIAIQTFLRHPVKEIRRLPDWEWRRLILAQIIITMITGALSGLARHSALAIFAGMIETPILTLVFLFISTLFFYYVFQIFVNTFIEFRELYTAVLFANIPFFIFQILSEYFPPILLIGLGFTALLLIVAFVANFRISRRFVSRLIGAIYVVFVCINVFAWWNTSRITDKWHGPSSTEHAPEVKLGE